MVHPRIKRELEERLNQLPLDLQRRVLDFASALVTSRPKGTKGQALLRFAGTIPQEDLQEMSRAIEEGCEQVDRHEW